ncbi:PQQ-binding-like beta-propeller repeat protein [Larkinella insperata]|uniref:PQQ-binding-like beta-propeller repeat protein n=1 Tax=Larkinella insperata TaxID=332158 RepID=A0ABW3QJ15_9BACT|nr:PQQ-binding-like beta-propeller repeat protein [Larkinella insperata]
MRNFLSIFFILLCLLSGCKKRQPDIDPVTPPATYTLYGSDELTCYAINASTGLKRWVFKSEYSLVGPPHVKNGMVFLKTEESLFALDAVTGTKRWESKTRPVLFTITDKVVYIVNSKRKLYALDAITGTKKWEFTSDLNGTAYTMSPTIANGLVYWVPMQIQSMLLMQYRAQ